MKLFRQIMTMKIFILIATIQLCSVKSTLGAVGPAMASTDPYGPATAPNGPLRSQTAPDGSRPGIFILTIFYSNIGNFYKKIFILH